MLASETSDVVNADTADYPPSPALGCSPSVLCSICLDLVIDDGERSIAKLQCGHKFHLDCIGSAFNTKGAMQCPNCRNIESGKWLFTHGSAHTISELEILYAEPARHSIHTEHPYLEFAQYSHAVDLRVGWSLDLHAAYLEQQESSEQLLRELNELRHQLRVVQEQTIATREMVRAFECRQGWGFLQTAWDRIRGAFRK